MSESIPAPVPAPVPVMVNPDPAIRRLRNLTILSLSLNGLILLLLVVGGIVHHHQMKKLRHQLESGGAGGGFAYGCPMDRDFGPRFHHFGGGFGGPPPGMPGMMGGPMNPPDPATMTDHILDHLTSALTLTDDQKAKIKPIVLDQVTQMQKEMEAQRAAMQKEIADARDKLKPLLNADQQKKLDALPIPGQKPPLNQ